MRQCRVHPQTADSGQAKTQNSVAEETKRLEYSDGRTDRRNADRNVQMLTVTAFTSKLLEMLATGDSPAIPEGSGVPRNFFEGGGLQIQLRTED